MSRTGGAPAGGPPELADLVGVSESSLVERLGEPDGSRTLGDTSWWSWTATDWRLRVRCGPADPGDGGDGGATPSRDRAGVGRTVASWSLVWSEGRESLRDAVEPLGLWPAAAPDVAAAELDPPLARRGIRRGEERDELSLTAGVRGGKFVRVACFDELPDWR